MFEFFQKLKIFILTLLENLRIFLMQFYRSCWVESEIKHFFRMPNQFHLNWKKDEELVSFNWKNEQIQFTFWTFADVLPILLELLQREMIIYIFSDFLFNWNSLLSKIDGLCSSPFLWYSHIAAAVIKEKTILEKLFLKKQKKN